MELVYWVGTDQSPAGNELLIATYLWAGSGAIVFGASPLTRPYAVSICPAHWIGPQGRYPSESCNTPMGDGLLGVLAEPVVALHVPARSLNSSRIRLDARLAPGFSVDGADVVVELDEWGLVSLESGTDHASRRIQRIRGGVEAAPSTLVLDRCAMGHLGRGHQDVLVRLAKGDESADAAWQQLIGGGPTGS